MLRYIRRKLDRLQGRPFLRSVIMLVGGTAFAQGLMVLILPVLTRLYTPADFDVLAVYVALLGLTLPVASLRYNIAIPLPESDKDGASLLIGALAINTAVGIGLILAIFIASETIVTALSQPRIAPFLWLVPVGVFAGAAYNVLQYWASRKKRFGVITQTRMTRAIGGAGTQLGLGVLASGPLGLMAGHAVYSGLGAVRLTIMALRQDRADFSGLSVRHIRNVLTSYRRFPLFSVPESLFDIGGIQIPILIIATTAIGPEAGYLMLAMQVLGAPVTLIGASVAQVYLSEASQWLRADKLADFTRKTMFTLFKTGAPPLLLLGGAAPFLFAPTFGDDWARAGVIAAWMTPSFVLQFVASPVSMVLHVTGRQGIAMILQAGGLLVRVSAVLWAVTYASTYIVEVYAVSAAVYYAAYLGVISLFTRQEGKE